MESYCRQAMKNLIEDSKRGIAMVIKKYEMISLLTR